MPTVPPLAELVAPAAWAAVDCISDLHLQADAHATVAALAQYLRTTPADAVCILGDLFEVWVGDDAAFQPGFEADCVALLRSASARLPVLVMHGNRDFLIGPAFHAAAGTTPMHDPTALTLGSSRWLLSHGDALCLADTAYFAFRAQVRGAAWQHNFLDKPLPERRAVARGLRQQSAAHQQAGVRSEPETGLTNAGAGAMGPADVDAAEAHTWLKAANAHTLVHGHTHRPADHELSATTRRVVLTDWDLASQPPRAEALRLSADGSAMRIPLSS